MIIDRGNVDKYDVDGILSVFLYYSAVFILRSHIQMDKRLEERLYMGHYL